MPRHRALAGVDFGDWGLGLGCRVRGPRRRELRLVRAMPGQVLLLRRLLPLRLYLALLNANLVCAHASVALGLSVSRRLLPCH
jgi:hypothetical protein